MQLEMYEERLLEGAKLLAQARSVTDEKNMQAVNAMSNSLRLGGLKLTQLESRIGGRTHREWHNMYMVKNRVCQRNMNCIRSKGRMRGTKRKKSGLNCLFSCSIRQMSDRNWQRMWIITDIMIRRPDIRI